MNIHKKLKDHLNKFIESGDIPHIVFHGPSGSGKRYILSYLINNVYSTREDKEKYLMYINCAHGRGIKFIRDELKFFAKTNIQKRKFLFKSIVLFNADKLTIDAQSALRRCIEEFSHTTRFFIVVENYDRLLNPIKSRFCNIYVPLANIDNKIQTLYSKNMENLTSYKKDKNKKTIYFIQKKLDNLDKKSITGIINDLYKKGYSGIDIMQYISETKTINEKKKYFLLIHFDNIRREFRNERLFMLYVLRITFA